MDITSNTIAKFIQLFEDALSNDDSIREKATSQILEILSTNHILLLKSCISIIMQDDVSLISQQYSFVILMRIFRPANEQPFEIVKSRYNSLPEQIQLELQTAFMRGLLFQQPQIYQQAAFLVSLIVVISSPQQAIEILNALQNLLISNEYYESVHFAAIKSFREIYLSNHINDLFNNWKDSQDFLNQQKNIYYEFLRTGYNYPASFITEVVMTLNRLISCYPIFFDNNDQSQLLTLFEMMLPQVIDSDLYGEIMMVLLTLVSNFYNSENLDIQRIIEITDKGITCSNPDFVCYSLSVWISIAKREIEIITNNIIHDNCQELIKNCRSNISNTKYDERIVRKRQEYRKFSILFASQKIENVLTVLTFLDPNDTSIEDTSLNQPHFFAFSLIRKIYMIEPYEMFLKINDLFAVSVNSDNWVVRHAYLNALSCMDSNDKFEFVADLFKKSTDFIIKCAFSGNDRLSETAVYTFEVIARNYSFYSTMKGISQMLMIVRQLIDRDFLIVIRTLNLLQQLINHEEAPVDEVFDDLIGLTIYVLNRSEYRVPDLVYKAFETLQFIIKKSTQNSIENVKKFLSTFVIESLQNTTELFLPVEQICMMQQCFLQTIMAIFEKFPHELTDEANKTLAILFPLIRKMNEELVSGDILLVFARITSALGKGLNEFAPIIFDYINHTLVSYSPSIIKNSVILISNLFDCAPSLIVNHLPLIPNTIDLILNCLNNQVFTPDFYPEVAKNLYFVIKSIDKIENYFDPIIRDKLFAIYKGMTALPIDLQNDIDFANSILECACLGFSIIIKFSKKEENKRFLEDLQDAKIVIKEVFKPVNYFAYLSKIYDDTLFAFLMLMEAACDNFTKRYNFLIQRNFYTSLLILAKANKNDYINKKAYEVWLKYIHV